MAAATEEDTDMSMGGNGGDVQAQHAGGHHISVGEHVWVAFYYDGDPQVVSQQQTSVASSLRPGPPPSGDEENSQAVESGEKGLFVVRSVCLVSYLDETEGTADLIRVYDGVEFSVPIVFLSHLPSRQNVDSMGDELKRAVTLKEEGNFFFKCKDFESARQVYESALARITKKSSPASVKVGTLALIQRRDARMARDLLYRPASVALVDGADQTCEVIYEDDHEPSEEEVSWNDLVVLPPRRAHEGLLDDLASQPLELYRQLCMNIARALLNFAIFSTDRGTYVRHSIFSVDKAICSCYLLRSSSGDQNAAEIMSSIVTGYFFRIKAHCALGQFKTANGLLESSRQMITQGLEQCDLNPQHNTTETLQKQNRQLQHLERHITMSQRYHQKADRKIAKEVAHWVDHAWKEGGTEKGETDAT
eukprot:gb/GECG01005064.1/.p1 GENE.gb/GECG01005064.1/~~gb/GECG01005064.1/.p1  ORF type:complete len:420 (+),score=50.77 gb/GECG01005064.1/:1-1260(+)